MSTDLILNHDGNNNYNVTLQNVPLIGSFYVNITSNNYIVNQRNFFINKNNYDSNGNINVLSCKLYYGYNSLNLNCEWLANSKPRLYGTHVFKYNNIDKNKIKIKVVINQITKKDWNIAAKNGYIDIIKYLFENKIGNYTESTMKIACSNNKLEIVKYLDEINCPYNLEDMFKLVCKKKSTSLSNYFYNKLKLKYVTKLDKIAFINMLKKFETFNNILKLKHEFLKEIIEQEINEIEISDEKKESLKYLITYI
jgi:hypothetical protein